MHSTRTLWAAARRALCAGKVQVRRRGEEQHILGHTARRRAVQNVFFIGVILPFDSFACVVTSVHTVEQLAQGDVLAVVFFKYKLRAHVQILANAPREQPVAVGFQGLLRSIDGGHRGNGRFFCVRLRRKVDIPGAVCRENPAGVAAIEVQDNVLQANPLNLVFHLVQRVRRGIVVVFVVVVAAEIGRPAYLILESVARKHDVEPADDFVLFGGKPLHQVHQLLLNVFLRALLVVVRPEDGKVVAFERFLDELPVVDGAGKVAEGLRFGVLVACKNEKVRVVVVRREHVRHFQPPR